MIGVGKTKLALYLTGIFLAGGISGWVVAARMDKQKSFKPPQPKAARYWPMRVPKPPSR